MKLLTKITSGGKKKKSSQYNVCLDQEYQEKFRKNKCENINEDIGKYLCDLFCIIDKDGKRKCQRATERGFCDIRPPVKIEDAFNL